MCKKDREERHLLNYIICTKDHNFISLKQPSSIVHSLIPRPTSSFMEVSAKAGQLSILEVRVNCRIQYWLRTSVVRRIVSFFLQEHAHIILYYYALCKQGYSADIKIGHIREHI